MTLQVRSAAAPGVLLDQLRGRVRALDANLPILDARPLTEQIAAAFMVFEMAARTLGIFGLTAIGLAALGIYGLVVHGEAEHA